MNKLTPPDIDDAAAFTALANNRRVDSFPRLQGSVPAITEGYIQYRAAGGNGFAVQAVQLDAEVGPLLRAHYRKPPGVLKYITDMRRESEHWVCPMCGSLHSGQLDHLLPKEDYAAFAVFSLNLVPACKCNTRRGRALLGNAPGERILHPYFDECLSERLIAARFDDLGLVPRVSLQLCVPQEHVQYEAIAFHKRRIVERTAILRYFADGWSNLCRRPRLAIRALAVVPASSEQLRTTLLEEVGLLDEEHGGKNNWNSAFVTGLLDPHVVDWLYARLAAPGRAADGPLVA
ncbi:hypothetical protein [Paraburkholderia sp. J76]|uniref:hypothetical protein n=1 Tax=Paraburkholderia sp. J76 TaxID=2805439 RepID=UPI002ABE8995|nr:hypothetical protein [Paraburkholderia sp. J76]